MACTLEKRNRKVCLTWSSAVTAFLVGCLLFVLNVANGQAIADQRIRLQAESASATYRCLETSIIGQSDGGSFLDFQGTGSWVEWSIDIATAGSYAITLGFASHNTRPLDLKINGVTADVYKCEGSGSWEDWLSETIVLNLAAGSQTVRLEATRSTGPNVDYLEVSRQGSGSSGGETSVINPKSPLAFKSFPMTTVLGPNGRIGQGTFLASPSGGYKLGLSNSGDLVLMASNGGVVWSAGVSGGQYCYMQSDGNLLIRASNGSLKWSAETSNNPGARLVIDDGGLASVIHGSTPLWFRGEPRGEYTGPSSTSLTFPIRGIFYCKYTVFGMDRRWRTSKSDQN
jgi:hypothetical protein